MKEKEESFKKNFYRTQGKIVEEIQRYKDNAQKLAGFPNFYAYLNSLTNLIDKDCAQVMRKYQYSFNKQIVDESTFSITIHHTPTCRKEEIPIQIIEEYLIIEIFVKIQNANYQEVKFTIKNQAFEKFKDKLESNLQSIFLNFKEPKLFNSLKFFDNYILDFFKETNIETLINNKQNFNGMQYSAPSKMSKISNSSENEKSDVKSSDGKTILNNQQNSNNQESKSIILQQLNEEEKGEIDQLPSKIEDIKIHETQNKEKAETIINNCLQIKIDCEGLIN